MAVVGFDEEEVVKRASLGELLKFANRVRAAGGGNAIDALAPAVPEDESQCLIAKNLNFNCSVGSEQGINGPRGRYDWYMAVDNEQVRNNIASALHLDAYEGTEGNFVVLLPKRIAAIAFDYDEVCEALDKVDWYIDQHHACSRRTAWEKALNRKEKKLVRDFTPYIEASILETHNNAGLVTEDGKIVV